MVKVDAGTARHIAPIMTCLEQPRSLRGLGWIAARICSEHNVGEGSENSQTGLMWNWMPSFFVVSRT